MDISVKNPELSVKIKNWQGPDKGDSAHWVQGHHL